ncbi:putative cyclic AMP-dependent transcription factor ATF-3 [Scophthalmus maximus]|uniref:Putative cyclic AMP-dependent transcription factor ATF-3 n=2 Tax=Scophthalmus maximus TaxID=52904 RepID=A0A2U9D0V3_SCOMX|nr:putative cyclic AMP-dependent transcription factor ATF-3 [Scophthalmus maximus]
MNRCIMGQPGPTSPPDVSVGTNSSEWSLMTSKVLIRTKRCKQWREKQKPVDEIISSSTTQKTTGTQILNLQVWNETRVTVGTVSCWLLLHRGRSPPPGRWHRAGESPPVVELKRVELDGGSRDLVPSSPMCVGDSEKHDVLQLESAFEMSPQWDSFYREREEVRPHYLIIPGRCRLDAARATLIRNSKMTQSEVINSLLIGERGKIINRFIRLIAAVTPVFYERWTKKHGGGLPRKQMWKFLVQSEMQKSYFLLRRSFRVQSRQPPKSYQRRRSWKFLEMQRRPSEALNWKRQEVVFLRRKENKERSDGGGGSSCRSGMMLQHPGPSLADISCSALVPCLSPPGTLTLDDFTNFTPIVKEELRLAIQTKRLSSGLSIDVSSDGASSCSDRAYERAPGRSGYKRESTPEEHERRKRRRERNKVAAAKCRNKKKEKTEDLQKESEKLESVNADLKAQIEELKQQKQQLVYMLNLHRPTCIVRAQNGQTPEDERNLFIQHIKESTLQLHNLTCTTTTSTSPCSSSTSTLATLDGGLLSLDHIHCSSLL